MHCRSGAIFDSNIATWRGGACFIESGHGSIGSSTFTNNSAIDGGACYVFRSNVLVGGAAFTYNRASNAQQTTGFGGAIFSWDSSNVVLQG